MTAKEIVIKLYRLHEVRKEMRPDSIYHGAYEKEAIELNKKLRSELGINYVDLTHSQIKNIVGLNTLFPKDASDVLVGLFGGKDA